MSTITLLSVTPLHWSSGYDHLLGAVRLLADRGRSVALRVEAGGPARERFLFTVDDLDLHGLVDLADGDADGVHRHALVLSAVVDEPWPAVLDSLARADRMVATDLGWCRSQLPGAELVRVRSATALADGIERVTG